MYLCVWESYIHRLTSTWESVEGVRTTGVFVLISSNHVPPSSTDCITNYTANADLSLQDHERNKLNRSYNRRTTPPISGDEVILGNLLHNQMILTPIAIDAHGRVGPMTRQNFYGTHHPPYPHVNNSSPIDPMQKLCMIEQPPFQPLSTYSSKQINDGNNFKQTILNTIKNSTDLAITLQQLP